jgi:hypothetical protein
VTVPAVVWPASQVIWAMYWEATAIGLLVVKVATSVVNYTPWTWFEFTGAEVAIPMALTTMLLVTVKVVAVGMWVTVVVTV